MGRVPYLKRSGEFGSGLHGGLLWTR